MQATRLQYAGFFLTAALLLPQAGFAGGSLGKALGGAVGSSTDDLGQALGKALGDVNVGRAVDGAVPAGAPNVGRAGSASNPAGGPNFNPTGAPNFSPPNPKSIYGPGPAAVSENLPTGNTARNLPAQGNSRSVYENAADALDRPRYDRVEPLPDSPRVSKRGPSDGAYDRLDDARMRPEPEYNNRGFAAERQAVQRLPSDPNLALQLPSPPTGTVRVANRQLARNASETAIEPVADAATSPGFLKRNKKLIGGIAGGVGLGGLSAGGYAIGADVAEGQAGGESKVTDAYNDTAQWAEDAYNDTVEWGSGAVETLDSWF